MVIQDPNNFTQNITTKDDSIDLKMILLIKIGFYCFCKKENSPLDSMVGNSIHSSGLLFRNNRPQNAAIDQSESSIQQSRVIIHLSATVPGQQIPVHTGELNSHFP